jgi:acetyl-CoA carboxylase biotin carboxyl carrier protein
LQWILAPCNHRRGAVRNRDLTYEDVLRIVDLVKTTRFSEFRLKAGDVEVHLRRSNGEATLPAGGIANLESPAVSAAQKPLDKSFPEGSVLVRAPMVGTFYRAPAPDAPPFVEVGQHVEPDTTVCVIEVMKLMNSIAAEARGVVAEVLAENGKHVEYGQVLMVIRPDPEDG